MFFKILLSYFYPLKEKTFLSPVNGTLEIYWERGKKVLNTKDANYSYGSLHTIFQKALKEIKFGQKSIENVLILGFGAGSIYEIIREEYKKEFEIVGVELDPTYKEIIPQFIDSLYNCTIDYEDALIFLEKNEVKYDLILCDLFLNRNTLNESMDKPFIKNIRKSLKENGCYIHNTMMPNNKEERDYFIALEQVFNEVSLEVYLDNNSVYFCK